jgi:leader peptidase (prepilin peptidase)/N-methyltransferase
MGDAMLAQDIEAKGIAGLVLGVGLFGSGLAAWTGPGLTATCAIALALAVVGLRIVWQDLAEFTISDTASVAVGLLGLTARIGDGASTGDPVAAILGFAILDAVCCGGVLLALRECFYRRRGYDGVGLGDVKLAAAGGILLGTVGLSWAILGASLAGLAIVATVRVLPWASQVVRVSDRIAFGAVLAPFLWATWLVGQIQPGTLARF